ncbi:methyltransferase domain-containing protein, partial [Magnetococcales bacterium HHB-1]
ERIAVSQESFKRLSEAPYRDHFILLTPEKSFLPTPFVLEPGSRRPVQVTRRGQMVASCCAPGDSCC